MKNATLSTEIKTVQRKRTSSMKSQKQGIKDTAQNTKKADCSFPEMKPYLSFLAVNPIC
jgi:hypothetical protein